MRPYKLAAMAKDIACNIGEEFPFPPDVMQINQIAALAEEGFELAREIRLDNLEGIKNETADVAITCYISAHYYGIDLAWHEAAAHSTPLLMMGSPVPERVGITVGAMRRFCGIARRRSTLAEVTQCLHATMAGVRIYAELTGFDLETAIQDKAAIIFGRGWREPSSATH